MLEARVGVAALLAAVERAAEVAEALVAEDPEVALRAREALVTLARRGGAPQAWLAGVLLADALAAAERPEPPNPPERSL